MSSVIISGTGIYVPQDIISNDELVHSFNKYVENFNQKHIKAIANNSIAPLKGSNADFIYNVSGIKNRHVIDKHGILNHFKPILQKRPVEQISVQAEMAKKAAEIALKNANKKNHEVDGIIIACSNLQRPYPAIAIETQNALGIKSAFAFDMNVACASASFGISVAYSYIKSNLAKCILVITPEIYTAHVNFKDRRSHFIFGDACVATLVETGNTIKSNNAFRIIGCNMQTCFSNNIRNNFGFLNRCNKQIYNADELLFSQNGAKVRKDVVDFAANNILQNLNKLEINKKNIKRLWLHQANIHINTNISINVIGKENVNHLTMPCVLKEYGNTGAAGVIIAFDKHNNDLSKNDYGVISSFGAGYSATSIVVQKI